MKPYLLSLPPAVSPSLSLSHSLFSLGLPSHPFPAGRRRLPSPAGHRPLPLRQRAASRPAPVAPSPRAPAAPSPRAPAVGSGSGRSAASSRTSSPASGRTSSPENQRGGSSAAHGQEGLLGLDRAAAEGAAAGILPRGRRPSPSTFFPSSSFPTPLGASGCICGRGAGGCGRAGEDTPMELGYWAVSHTDTYPILSF